MRTRIVSIVIEQDTDGQKLTARRVFPADALLLMDPQVAGEGFLQILQGLVELLDGSKARKVETPMAAPNMAIPNQPEPPVESMQNAPPPSHDPADPGFTTKRIVKKKPVAV